ncbi:hypothetical protein KK141_11020 [Dyella sp. LX-66]|uniref:hypothetical protein n=1 Tax=unclassified Dyella TaxID=2634549 RepID=UPI001BE04641|nr:MULTISPECIES: hypothetical protein [unclassified Dyella]MBT2117207.1 hypothetical protein [Dyella sp. LX-1]MBT2118944.1 hypothetical protein [Dyella sp. LX-1]MBT2139717.1 hypothetical protein [Dyella sp. LX-66]MBT2140062.1 hypothetical protein [Dyella sp. LX-66]
MKKFISKVANGYNAAGLALFGAISSSAFAQTTDMTTAFSGEVTAGKGQLYTIGGIVLTLCAIALLIAMAKRSAK